MLFLAAVSAQLSSVNAAVDKVIASQKPVGAAVGIVKDGALVYTKVYGLRNIAKNEPVDIDTRFNIGSVTKQFTAAAILQLQEQGKLAIDDKLSKYEPAFPHANEITLRQLLNQVSGLADYLERVPPGQIATGGSLDAVAKLVDVPLRFTPGTKWEYSNTNYYVLGNVIEKVSGESYESYVRAHLFGPAGMTHSGFMSDEPSMSDFATGYWNGMRDNAPLQPAPEIREGWAGGAGAIVSTIADMAAWDTALHSGKIVNKQDYETMIAPPKLPNNAPDTYGMGLGVDPLDGHARIWHNGGSLGSFTMNSYFPNDGVHVIVFENSTSGDPGAVETAVVESMFPDAAVAARTAAPGEDVRMRPRILHLLNEVLHGTLQPSELDSNFAKMATPQTQKQIAAQLAPLGAAKTIIFKGKRIDDRGTAYIYRVEFVNGTATFMTMFDKASGLVGGIGIQ
ncbi:MAG TPA: serine hydrolase domain-containing protein [Candidatus Baltobacteraceae bacterium]|nr:serine hydrolase domain-containing protein [Candidatus Baltobacteraceae bacterium]